MVIPGAGLARGGDTCSSCERLKVLAIELQEQIDVQGKIIEGLVSNSPVTDMPVTDDGYGDDAVSGDVKKEEHEGVDAGPTTYGVEEVAEPAPSAAPAAAAATSSSSSSSSSSNTSKVR